MKKLTTLLILAISTLSHAWTIEGYGEYKFDAISNNVYVIHGPLDEPNLGNQGFMNNPGMVIGANGVIVIDPGGTLETGRSLLKRIQQQTKNPVTHGSFKRLPKEEARFDFSILDEAIARREVVAVDQIVAQINQKALVPVVKQVSDEVVIDIRPESERKRQPLVLASEILEIPFYELSQKFKRLDSAKNYLLYCQKGVMSQLHAQYLIDQGF